MGELMEEPGFAAWVQKAALIGVGLVAIATLTLVILFAFS